jgi:2-haloacid dehalogenase
VSSNITPLYLSCTDFQAALYRPFSDITNASLRHALDESGATLSEADIKKLMKAYDSLGTFPDVPPALKSLASDPNIDAYVFSNGTDAMVSSSVNQSPSLSVHASVFKGLITVQEIEVYKPDAKVYQYLAKTVGKTTSKEDMGTIWLVSGNPFDIVGARAAGLQAAWVDRIGGHHGKGGWTDKLGELAAGGPTVVVKGVEEAVDAIQKWKSQNVGNSGAGHNKEAAVMGPG